MTLAEHTICPHIAASIGSTRFGHMSPIPVVRSADVMKMVNTTWWLVWSVRHYLLNTGNYFSHTCDLLYTGFYSWNMIITSLQPSQVVKTEETHIFEFEIGMNLIITSHRIKYCVCNSGHTQHQQHTGNRPVVFVEMSIGASQKLNNTETFSLTLSSFSPWKLNDKR